MTEMQDEFGSEPQLAKLLTKVLFRRVLGVRENVCGGVPICTAMPLDCALPSSVKVIF